MSELRDAKLRPSGRSGQESRLRFTPDATLEVSLRSFLKPHDSESEPRGRRGLFLYADAPIIDDYRAIPSVPRRGGSESAAIAGLGQVIRRRSLQHRQLGKKLQLEALPKETPGIAIKMDVILDPMTAQAITGFMKINYDRSVGVHMDIRRAELVSREEYFAACHHLLEQLMAEGQRPGVAVLELVRTRAEA